VDLPRRYSYNPGWRQILFAVGSGLLWIIIIALECNCRPHGFVLWFGLTPITVGLVVAVRRMAFNRYLVLDSDALTLPTGFLRMRTKRIPYADIERVWGVYTLWMMVLYVGTKRGKFEVLSPMLPDARSFLEVGNFLHHTLNSPAPD
jgi:hypothetical protein